MTTPALTTDLKASIFPSFHMTRYNGPYVVGEEDVTFQGPGTARRQLRPASGTSVVRPDGTRAPRAWDHRWALFEPLHRQVHVRRRYLSFIEDYQGFCPMAGNLLTPSINFADAMAQAGGLPWCSGFATGFPISVYNEAVTRLRNRARAERTQLGTTLGELRSTVRGISQAANEILDFVNAVYKGYRYTKADLIGLLTTGKLPKRSGRRRDRIRDEKKILDEWLQVQFSLKPLLQDIQQSGEALSWLLFEERLPLRFTVKSGASTSWLSNQKGRWPAYQSPYYWADTTQPLVSTAEVHISCVFEVLNTTTRTIDQLGLGNPAAVAWELTQFSWMVDYVLGIGDWLGSMAPLHGTRFVEGSVSRKAEVRINGPLAVQAVGSVETLYNVHGTTSVGICGRFNREVLTSTPAPALLPSVRNRLGLTQLANTLAVVSQLASASR